MKSWDRPIWFLPLLWSLMLLSALMLYTTIRTTLRMSTPRGFQDFCGNADSVQAGDPTNLRYGDIQVSFSDGHGPPQYWRNGYPLSQRVALDIIGCTTF